MNMLNGAVRTLRTAAVAILAAVFMLVGLVPMSSYQAARSEPAPAAEATGEYVAEEHFMDVGALDAPQTYVATLDFLGFQDVSRKVARVRVNDAHLVSVSPEAEAEKDWSHRFVGRTVLASVLDEVASDIGTYEGVTVEMYAVPNGDTVSLTIGQIVRITSLEQATVSSLSLSAAPPGSEVTLGGNGFGATQLDSWVTVCGARAQIRSWSDTEITFVVPSGATRAGYVGVVVEGVTSNGMYFTPFGSPVLTNITPRDGSVGTIVTFSGTGFGDTQGDGWVSFAGALGQVVSWSDTEIRAVVPRGAGSGYAGVVANGLSSNGVFFAPYGSPVVEDVSPSHAIIGDLVTVKGHDFGSTQGTLLIGGVPHEVESWTTTEITARIPTGSTSGYVGVVREGPGVSNGVFLTVAPRIASVSAWWAEPGETISITGEGFGDTQGSQIVYVGGATATVASWTDTVVTAVVPAGATSGYVGIGCDGACSNGIYLVVLERPQISEVSTTSVSPGTEITVTGSRFGSAGSSTLVLARSYEFQVMSWSESRIVARVPASATSGYLGVIKQGVASNGIWLDVSQ